MTAASRFSDRRYLNWLKSTLSLLYLKNGIESIIDNEAKCFHDDLQKTLGVYGSAPKRCLTCTSTNISPDYRRRMWHMSCRLCDSWLQQILLNHVNQHMPKLSPVNTDPQLWPASEYEVCKVFMPYGCQQNMSAKDGDIQSLLSLIKNCLHFIRCGRIGRMDLIDDLLRIRNSRFHSGDFTVDDADVQVDMQTAIDFRQGLTNLSPSESQSVQEALDLITKVQTGILDVSINKELELHALQLKQNALDTELKRLDNGLNDHKEQSSATEDTVQRIQTDVDIYQTKLSEVDAGVQNIQLKATTTETDLTSLTLKTKNLEQSIHELQAVKVHFNKFLQANDLEHDMSRLSTCIQHHKERLQNLETQSRNLHEHHAVTQSNLRKTLLSLYERNFRKIPVFDEIIVDLEELYVGQEMKIINQSGKSRGEGKSAEQPDKENTTINAIEDIFYKDGKICENVLISSEPGVGKSTFCKFLVRQWYNGHTLDKINLTPCQRAMREFKLLFYIDLKEANIEREAQTSDEIATIIHEQLELTDICSISDIRKCLSEQSTLVLMDSLDELSSTRYPSRGKHNQSCIVTTSRPWKIEALRSKLKDVTQHIEIVGLAKESATTLADNVLKLINEGSSQMKTGDAFIRDMKKKELQHFLNTPLLLIQMLGLWFSGKSFGNSEFEIYSKVSHHQICIAVKTKSLPNNVGKGLKQVFPFCDKTDQCPCRVYGELMWKVAQLAYHTLYNKDRQMCLVFDHEVTKIYGLSTEEVELCLKIGILTQHKLIVINPIEKKKTVSFPHKTYQEYFASIYLSRQNDGQMSDLYHIRSVTCNLDQALELDKVLLFCSQLDIKSNANATRQLSFLISVKADEDHRVQEYRQSCIDDPPHIDLIKKIQNMISTATQQNAVLFLSDIILDGSPLWYDTDNQIDTIDVRHLDMTGVISIHVKNYSVAAEVLKQLKQCQNLQKLVLVRSGINVKNIHEMLARNRGTVLTIGLGGDWIDLSPLGKKLIETFSEKLSSLSLSFVKLSHQQCQQLSEFLSSSHSQSWLPFSSHRTATHNLRELELEYISCVSLLSDFRTCLKLDLTMQENLQTVKFICLPGVKVKLNPHTIEKIEIGLLMYSLSTEAYMIQCLPAARNLRELTCHSIKDCQQLATVLPQLHSLRRLVMSKIDFSCLSQISLSATMKQLEYVELFWCTLTDKRLRSLISSLPGHRVEVVLRWVTVKDEFLHDIRQSSTTQVLWDEVKKTEDGWWVEWLRFHNNPRP